ncbi:MAG: hypothetical protein GTO63_05760 [Anaerolineae bacterium]|nr:hypothetical protein [Anaerolineae bacterium]NIN94479.1 hypothetical protein [Anaerolineae bacterium]NIQ77547.1 hypothetical protein [Anaerolineae bacterium]
MNTKFNGPFASVSVELTERGWEYLARFKQADAREKLRIVRTMAEHAMANDIRFAIIDTMGEEVPREQEEQSQGQGASQEGEGGAQED